MLAVLERRLEVFLYNVGFPVVKVLNGVLSPKRHRRLFSMNPAFSI